MPDEIDDFFAELDAVAEQVQQQAASARAVVPAPEPAPVPVAVKVESSLRVAAESTTGAAAEKNSSASLDYLFGDGAPAGPVASDTPTAARADALSEFFGGDTGTPSVPPAQSPISNLRPEYPNSDSKPAEGARAVGAAEVVSSATPLDGVEASQIGDTSTVLRHTLLCNLSLCRRASCDGISRSGSGEAVMGPGSWCKVVLELNEPQQTVDLQSWQLQPNAVVGADTSEALGVTVAETVLLSFWKGRAPPKIELTLWFTSCDADNSNHPDDDSPSVAWHRAGAQVVELEPLPLFAFTVVPLDGLSQLLRAHASVSVRPTDCDLLPDPQTKHSRRDEWGFSVELCNPAPVLAGAQAESESVGRHHRRSMQWQRALRRATQAEQSGADGAQQREYRKELRRICCKGVPSPHRGYAWYVLSGARDKALASTTTGETAAAAGSHSSNKAGPSEYQAKLAEAREEIAWYANGGAARLRAKTRATVHGGARLCGVASGPVGTYTAALIRQYNAANEQRGVGKQSATSDFGMQLHPRGSEEAEVVVSSVAPGSPADHAGEMWT